MKISKRYTQATIFRGYKMLYNYVYLHCTGEYYSVHSLHWIAGKLKNATLPRFAAKCNILPSHENTTWQSTSKRSLKGAKFVKKDFQGKTISKSTSQQSTSKKSLMSVNFVKKNIFFTNQFPKAHHGNPPQREASSV